MESRVKEREKGSEEEEKGEEKREGRRSRSSSTSSEDYIIILPDCFDTSRPLGESMYSSALSQPGDITAKTPTDPETPSPDQPGPPAPGGLGEADEDAAASVSGNSSANDMLCTSQTLDDEPLTPEVVPPPLTTVTPSLESSGETDAEPAAAEGGADGSELYRTEG
ncbi:next to BRCA1 gene 1 protein-like, partial [Notothenia coriiceps]|uniref:Next to BRCA1 gene 1 protein-like n=1 Tax=Notothenia coriiceps TaxID=8208 RepID=A0A6I9NUF6_9TELE